MLLLVLGILGAVGFSLYHFGEQQRFNIISDSKEGIFILDKKTSMINYCTNKTCSLVGNGALPSHIMGNPAAMASMQGAIMGAPAAPAAPAPGQAPAGMQPNIAASGSANAAPAATAPAATDGDVHDADAEAGADHQDADQPDAAAAPAADADHPDSPEGFSF
jgi:hypothetical protein